MKGQILHEIFEEMNIMGVKIKKISCWKFPLTFSSAEAKKDFDVQSVRDWVSNFKEPHYEHVFINMKIAVEISGLPLHAWSEENLKLLTKNIGDWGWWINGPDNMRGLEIPKICGYTSSLDKIEKSEQVRLGKVCHHVKMVEVD